MSALFDAPATTDPESGLHTAELRAVPAPGDVLAVRLYRVLDGRSDADLTFVLDAVRAVVGAGSSDVPGDEREAWCRWSLEEARKALGCIPSRPAYDRWRNAQPNPNTYAPATTIRRALGDGDWTKAVQVLGGLVPDVSARRLLSRGSWFSAAECRDGVLMFFATRPAPDRSVENYRRWARRYSRRADAKRVPLDPQVIRERLQATWRELRAEYARVMEGADASASVETDEAAKC